jgi:hypothetical protein
VRDYGKTWKAIRPRGDTMKLMVFLERHMRQPIDGPFRKKDGGPSILNTIEEPPSGWSIDIRDRIVVLLTDRLRYWEHLGLSEAASTRTMALASISIGNFPRISDADMKKGITVAAAIERETAAIRAARSRVKKLVSA